MCVLHLSTPASLAINSDKEKEKKVLNEIQNDSSSKEIIDFDLIGGRSIALHLCAQISSLL